jgi:DNA-binding transcriptional MerR regulator
MKTERYFEIKVASRLCGLTVAMVDYLCRSSIVVPSARSKPGRGRGRRFTFGDIVMLRVLAQLLSCGISVAKMKRALEQLRKHQGKITPASLPGNYLFTDGRTLYFHDRSNAVEELTEGRQLAFAFVIRVSQVRDDVNEAVQLFDRNPKRKAAGTRV